MGTVDLRKLDGDEVVIHFGGTLKSVDAYTFANSLVSFADTIREINKVVDPKRAIEVRVEALSPGSFRAKIKKFQKGIKGFFSDGASNVFWGLVGALIYDNLFDEEPNLIIKDDSVIYEYGRDRIIVPREAHTHFKNVRKKESISRNVQRTFAAIEKDGAVENFGLTKDIDDKTLLVEFTREEIEKIAVGAATMRDPERQRERTIQDRLIILKAWLKPGKNKWSFDWNGVPIAAPIVDDVFLQRLADHEVSIGVGDAIDATIYFRQEYNEQLSTWVTDQNSYSILSVIAFIERK